MGERVGWAGGVKGQMNSGEAPSFFLWASGVVVVKVGLVLKGTSCAKKKEDMQEHRRRNN